MRAERPTRTGPRRGPRWRPQWPPTLRDLGVGEGDRVVGYPRNCRRAVVLILATAVAVAWVGFDLPFLFPSLPVAAHAVSVHEWKFEADGRK